jgi:hypothetical protein
MSDAHATVAVTDSQPEAAVLVSFLAWHGIPAYALGRHAAVQWPLVVALGGIPVRVPAWAQLEAEALLAEVAARPAVIRPATIRSRPLSILALLLHFALTGAAPPPRTRSRLAPYSAASST